MDKGEFKKGDAAPVQALLTKFDRVFAVLQDDDAEKLRALGFAGAAELTDAEVEAQVAQRNEARKRRAFAAGDRIRKELADRGIILEDTKDGGVRWKRK
jgi:cysteinyl-tRNA synthetase